MFLILSSAISAQVGAEEEGEWVVSFTETLGYTKPYVRENAGLGSAYPTVFANTYYVDAAAAGGGNGTEGSPWNALSSLSGQTTAGGCRVYLKGNFGLLAVTSGTFAGTSDSYILFQPWPNDSTPATWTSQSTGASTANASRITASGWNYQIWDGGPDMLFRFNGSGSTSGQNAYGTYFNTSNITLFRCRFDNQNATGPATGISIGDGAVASGIRFVNCEIYNGQYYGCYTGGGSNISTGSSSHQNVAWIGCVMHDVRGYGILLEPRDGGGSSSGVLIEGNVFRRVAYGTVNGSVIPNVIAPANAGGVSIANTHIFNNLAWDLGGGFLHDTYDLVGTLVYNNTVYDYAQLTPASLNSHAFTSESDGDALTVRNNIAHTGSAAGANPFNRDSGWTDSNNVSSGSIFQSTDEDDENFLKPTGGTVVNAGFNTSGTITTDYLGNSRLQGAAVDIGAFES